MSNYSEYLVDYYNDLETVLVNAGHITVLSGTSANTPIVSGVSSGAADEEVIGTITNYDSSGFYWVSSSGTSTISGSKVVWLLPSAAGTHTANVYTVKENHILSYPGQWQVGVMPLYITVNGSPTFDDTIKRYGTHSLYLGINDYVEIDDDDWMAFGSQNYVIQFWYREDSNLGDLNDAVIVGQGDAWRVKITNYNRPSVYANSGQAHVSCDGTVSTGAWHHISMVRVASQETHIYVDGGHNNYDTNGVHDVPNVIDKLRIGRGAGLAASSRFCGWIDELQIKVGTSSWSTSGPYTVDQYTELLMHFDNSYINEAT